MRALLESSLGSGRGPIHATKLLKISATVCCVRTWLSCAQRSHGEGHPCRVNGDGGAGRNLHSPRAVDLTVQAGAGKLDGPASLCKRATLAICHALWSSEVVVGGVLRQGTFWVLTGDPASLAMFPIAAASPGLPQAPRHRSIPRLDTNLASTSQDLAQFCSWFA